MQITFWGVRGSYPVPGASTVRYGGQTSCVETRTAGGDMLIVDAGTGMRALGNKLSREMTQPQHHHVLLSHVHWDHIQGLPFFSPVYVPGTKISVYALLTAADELHQVIGGVTRPERFPTALAVGGGGRELAVSARRAAPDGRHRVTGGIPRHEFFPMPLEAVPAVFEFHQVE